MSYLFNDSSVTARAGKQHRVNLDRFFHIMNEGWFIYTRKGQKLSANQNTTDGIAGPFESKIVANDFLTERLDTTSSSNSGTDKQSPSQDAEDWRY